MAGKFAQGPLPSRGAQETPRARSASPANSPSNVAIPQKGHPGAFPDFSTELFHSPAGVSEALQQAVGSEGRLSRTAMIPAPRVGPGMQ